MDTRFSNQEAEQVILGTIIMNNIFYYRIADLLEEKHFYFEEHKLIWKRFKDVIQERIANEVTLKDFFANKEELKPIGGINYINQLKLQATGIIDIKDYSITLIKLWQKRELKRVLEESMDNLEDDFNAIKDNLDDEIGNLSFALSKEPRKIGDIAKEIIEAEHTQKELIDIGFSGSDKLIGGVALGNLFILAGRSSSGKTTMCLNIARNLAKNDGVIFFSIEVNDSSLVRKFITEQGSINPYRLKKGLMNQSELQAAQESIKVINQSKMIIDDDSSLTLTKIRSRIKRLSNKHLIKVICIDYLQLMTPEGKDFSREQQISKIVVGLKSIAREFNIVVIALSQLSRATDSRDNKRPILSDLRDSGAIEQAADVVAFVHRDEYYLEREREPEHSKYYEEWLRLYNASKGKADFIIAKNRDGQIGDVKFNFDGQFSRFTEEFIN